MKTNLANKTVATLLIGFQMTGFAFADTGSTKRVDDSQEQALLANLISLSGQEISRNDFQNEVLPMVNDYEKASPIEGRSDRIAQAALEMNLIRPEKIAQIKTAIDETVGEQMKANPNMSEDQRNQLAMEATLQEINMDGQGAQFSNAACMTLLFGGIGIVIGSIFANVYASTLTHSSSQTSSTGSEQGSGTVSTTSQGSQSTSSTTTVSGSSTTTSSSVTPNETEKKLLITSAVIGYGISGTMLLLSLIAIGNDGCGN